MTRFCMLGASMIGPATSPRALKPFYGYLLLRGPLEDGRIESLDQPVMDFQPCLRDLNANLNYKDRQLTFRHLANQTACLGFREAPGTAFDYNDATMGFFWDVLINRVYKTPWDRGEGSLRDSCRSRLVLRTGRRESCPAKHARLVALLSGAISAALDYCFSRKESGKANRSWMPSSPASR